MSNNIHKCKFVAGDNPAPRFFAQKTLEKIDEKELVTRTGKIVFNAGADSEIQEVPRLQSTAELAGEIYNKMLIQNMLYKDLLNFNTKFSPELRDMVGEMEIMSFAMLRIYQSLSRNNRIPYQNQRKPQINNFCNGVVVTSNYLRGIMFDLRRLQRQVRNQNTDLQLIIIHSTLQSHQLELQAMRQDCIENGRL